MNEQLLIYLFCTDLSYQLKNIMHMKEVRIKKNGGPDVLTPNNLALMADVRKLANDIKELNQVANKQVEAGVQILTVNYGCKFQFMVPEENKTEGKEIKLTP